MIQCFFKKNKVLRLNINSFNKEKHKCSTKIWQNRLRGFEDVQLKLRQRYMCFFTYLVLPSTFGSKASVEFYICAFFILCLALGSVFRFMLCPFSLLLLCYYLSILFLVSLSCSAPALAFGTHVQTLCYWAVLWLLRW